MTVFEHRPHLPTTRAITCAALNLLAVHQPQDHLFSRRTGCLREARVYDIRVQLLNGATRSCMFVLAWGMLHMTNEKITKIPTRCVRVQAVIVCQDVAPIIVDRHDAEAWLRWVGVLQPAGLTPSNLISVISRPLYPPEIDAYSNVFFFFSKFFFLGVLSFSF